MRGYIYQLVCTDAWGVGYEIENIWAPEHRTQASCLFRTRREAVAAKRLHDQRDYGVHVRPTFMVERVEAVEAAYVAWKGLEYSGDYDHLDVFDRVLALTDAPTPAGYVPGETDGLSREAVESWIASLSDA